MDIEHVYYWFATIAMMMAILFLLGMVILLFYIQKKIKDIHSYIKYVLHKTDHIVDGVNKQVNIFTSLRDAFMGKSSK